MIKKTLFMYWLVSVALPTGLFGMLAPASLSRAVRMSIPRAARSCRLDDDTRRSFGFAQNQPLKPWSTSDCCEATTPRCWILKQCWALHLVRQLGIGSTKPDDLDACYAFFLRHDYIVKNPHKNLWGSRATCASYSLSDRLILYFFSHSLVAVYSKYPWGSLYSSHNLVNLCCSWPLTWSILEASPSAPNASGKTMWLSQVQYIATSDSLPPHVPICSIASAFLVKRYTAAIFWLRHAGVRPFNEGSLCAANAFPIILNIIMLIVIIDRAKFIFCLISIHLQFMLNPPTFSHTSNRCTN